ncbi:MAG: YfiR family protein [Verrucomicrobia bacterium]|nr:YfiR family protein [Verrucomicrobiota bacterium]
MVQGRPVLIKRVSSAAQARNCDLVFISREEARRQSLWLAELAGAPLLSVTETETSLKPKAGVTLVREKTSAGSRLRFDVNLPALQLARLKVSSSMLVSARRIVRATPERG